MDRFAVVGVQEIARIFGVEVNTAYRWLRRDFTTPLPVEDTKVGGNTRIWALERIYEWAAGIGRRPMVGLTPDETNYLLDLGLDLSKVGVIPVPTQEGT